MEITVYREQPLAREARQLPAATYNLVHVLLARSPGTLFVPIRAMQYLAIVDAEEIVFVDYLNKSRVEIAWQAFRPQARDALDEPVPYDAVYYGGDSAGIMRRLQTEFLPALTALAAKEHLDGPARVLKFERPAR
ncbi:MAG: hypothetical protein PHR30_13620 [Gallionellaceae bacterium]|nr:hypothetical protein [Gallionellaceae bacterium]MDD5366372.1 hypothetical protein [Gallionellaceae bacterium]